MVIGGSSDSWMATLCGPSVVVVVATAKNQGMRLNLIDLDEHRRESTQVIERLESLYSLHISCSSYRIRYIISQLARSGLRRIPGHG